MCYVQSSKDCLNRQRLLLLTTSICIVATSICSALHYEVRTGLVFPFIAPLILLPLSVTSNPLWWLAAVAVAGIVFGVGSVAWHYCKPLLTYSFVAGTVLLVAASLYLTYLLGLTGSA